MMAAMLPDLVASVMVAVVCDRLYNTGAAGSFYVLQFCRLVAVKDGSCFLGQASGKRSSYAYLRSDNRHITSREIGGSTDAIDLFMSRPRRTPTNPPALYWYRLQMALRHFVSMQPVVVELVGVVRIVVV